MCLPCGWQWVLRVHPSGLMLCLHGPSEVLPPQAKSVQGLLTRCSIDTGAEVIDEDATGAAAMFPEGTVDPRGADMCEHTAQFRTQRFPGTMPMQPRGFVLSSALAQEFFVWVVAIATLLGVLLVLVTRQRKKAKQKAMVDSVFSGREGGGKFDADIIREYKERYYARERGLEAAMKRAHIDEHRDD
jgi:hypothetical protein